MYIAFLLFLSCTIGRIQKKTVDEGVQLLRVEYSGSQIGVEQQFLMHINRVIRQEGWFGRNPIVLELISVEERWQSPQLWGLEVKAHIRYQDRKSPMIRYRAVERIQYLERFVETRQNAYQMMYLSLSQRVFHWLFIQGSDF
ncbi:MAG: hypothetical protein VX278_01320 [Myxococcota bacterium]|nr:hypothetical protein [Myxococcota bacterium]